MKSGRRCHSRASPRPATLSSSTNTPATAGRWKAGAGVVWRRGRFGTVPVPRQIEMPFRTVVESQCGRYKPKTMRQRRWRWVRQGGAGCGAVRCGCGASVVTAMPAMDAGVAVTLKSGALFKAVEEKLKIQNLVCDFATVAPLEAVDEGHYIGCFARCGTSRMHAHSHRVYALPFTVLHSVNDRTYCTSAIVQ